MLLLLRGLGRLESVKKIVMRIQVPFTIMVVYANGCKSVYDVLGRATISSLSMRDNYATGFDYEGRKQL